MYEPTGVEEVATVNVLEKEGINIEGLKMQFAPGGMSPVHARLTLCGDPLTKLMVIRFDRELF